MRLITSALLLTPLMIQGPATRAIPLASTMEDTSRQREYNVTGSQSQISYGDNIAGDADGAYDFSDTSTRFGSAMDIFPNETNFSMGLISFDNHLVTGVGNAFLRHSSVGASNAVLIVVMFSCRNQWADNYMKGCVTDLRMKVRNLGSTTLQLRVGFNHDVGERGT